MNRITHAGLRMVSNTDQPPLNNGSTLNPFLTTEDLSVYYRDKAAIEKVSLPVMENRITALIGPSGCGKSSFLLALNRLTDLIPGCRVRGRILLGDTDILDKKTDPRLLRMKVGIIFQKPSPFPISIWRNIALPLIEHGVKDKELLDHYVEMALKKVGLWEEVKYRLKEPAISLSGGQQQRLCFARALSLEPDALLLDEPCSSLDPISSGVVEDLICGLRGRYTVLIVTHNLAQARRISDYTSLFWSNGSAGNLIEYGETKEFFTSPKNEISAAYLSGMRG